MRREGLGGGGIVGEDLVGGGGIKRRDALQHVAGHLGVAAIALHDRLAVFNRAGGGDGGWQDHGGCQNGSKNGTHHLGLPIFRPLRLTFFISPAGRQRQWRNWRRRRLGLCLRRLAA
jgi:hypothetical protein